MENIINFSVKVTAIPLEKGYKLNIDFNNKPRVICNMVSYTEEDFKTLTDLFTNSINNAINNSIDMLAMRIRDPMMADICEKFGHR